MATPQLFGVALEKHGVKHPAEPVDIKVNGDFVDAIIPVEDTAPYEHIVEVKVPLNNGGYIALTDYASAGKLWNEESKMAAWIKVVR